MKANTQPPKAKPTAENAAPLADLAAKLQELEYQQSVVAPVIKPSMELPTAAPIVAGSTGCKEECCQSQAPRRTRISVREIADRLGIGKVAVYGMLEHGIIPGVHFGHRWIVTRHAYQNWENTCGQCPKVSESTMVQEKETAADACSQTQIFLR